jgi:hypothetical protein
MMDRQQFADYIFQGLGRPYLYLQRHDAAPYREQLLHACLYNPVYDPQCEGSRASYLYKIIQLTHDTAWYTQRLLESLAAPDDEMDIGQLLDFALIFAQGGNSLARRLMYEHYAASATSGDTVGATELIALDGFKGFLYVVEQLGQLAATDLDAWDHDYLLRHLEEQIGAENARSKLEEARVVDPNVRQYLEVVEQSRARREQSRLSRGALANQPYEQIKPYLLESTKKATEVPLMRWGKQASDSDLWQAAHDLLTLTDAAQLRAYLTIFRRRQFPLDWRALLPLVSHKNERVARWTIQQLGYFRDPDLRQLGFDLIAKSYYTSDAVELFTENFRDGDEQFFAALLERTTDQDGLHAIGLSISEVFERNPRKETAKLFVDLYERGPCSICREHFVERLIEIEQMPAWMIAEGRHDSNDGIRSSITAYERALSDSGSEPPLMN